MAVDRLYRAEIQIPAAQIGSGGVSNYTATLTHSCFTTNCSKFLDADGSESPQADGGDVIVTLDEAGENRVAIDIIKFSLDNTPASSRVQITVGPLALSAVVANKLYIWWGHEDTQSQPAVAAAYGQYATYHSTLEGYWPMTEGSGATIYDRTDGQYHGSMNFSNWESAGRNGLPSPNFGVEADTRWIDMPYAAVLKPNNEYTVSMALKPDMAETVSPLGAMTQTAASAVRQCFLFSASGSAKTYTVYLGSDSTSDAISLGGVYDGNWDDILLRETSNLTTCYLDGVAIADTSVLQKTNNVYNWDVGRFYHNFNNFYWAGLLGDLRIFSTPLGEADAVTFRNNSLQPATFAEVQKPALFELSSFGRQGIGVVQPQSGTDFPLVGVPSLDVRYLLADAYLSYDDPADYTPELVELALPFRIAWIYGLGVLNSTRPTNYPAPVHDVDMLVVDANNCVVFDSTKCDSFYYREWTDRLDICGWHSGSNGSMFIAIHTKWGETADPNIIPVRYESNIAPEYAILDERSVERLPKRVKSLTVVLDNYSHAVDFVEGYNMNVSHEGEFLRGNGLRVTQRVLFDASAGNGLGIFPGCEPELTAIRKINNVRPTDSGDYYLAANDCYYARQPSTIVNQSPREAIVTPAMIQAGNDCGPCCPCEDYVETAEYMNRTRDSYDWLGRQFEGIRTQYHENRDRWLASKCCFERFPLRLVAQPQLCPAVDIGLQFCNLTDQCVSELELQLCVEIIGVGIIHGSVFSISSISSASSESSVCSNPISEEVLGFTFIRGQTYKSPRRSSEIERYRMGGEHPCYTAYWDSVEAAQSVWVRFRLNLGCCGVDASGNPLYVKLTLTGSVSDPIGSDVAPITVPICGSAGSSISSELAIANRQVLLRCPVNTDDTYDPVCPDGEKGCATPTE